MCSESCGTRELSKAAKSVTLRGGEGILLRESLRCGVMFGGEAGSAEVVVVFVVVVVDRGAAESDMAG